MRIVHIVPSLEARHGGPSKSVRALCVALADLGHDVTLFATEPGAGWVQVDGRLTIEVVRRDWPDRIARSRALAGRLRETPADVVHHHSLWLRTLHYARGRAGRSRIPLVISPRGMLAAWSLAHRKWRKRAARILIHPGAFAAASGWHATSEEEASAVDALGFGKPVCIAPNGIELPSEEERAESAKVWREVEPRTASRRVALFYSRFHRKKRLLELIDCWLEKAASDWLLLVAGIPDEYSIRQVEEYVLRAGGLGRIAVADGAGRPPPFAAASLFLLPSHNENFGQAIAEALAYGIPALVTDGTPWSELNRHGGWCVPWDQYGQALKAATAESPELLRARGEAARQWVGGEYSWARSARALFEFYSRLGASA